MRIVFAGTPDFAVPALEALLASAHDIVAVYTQPDRPAGRGRKLTASPVKQCAEAAGVPVCQPTSLKSDDAFQRLAEWRPDLMVVVAYGLILPPAVLETPTHGCLNIHASLLPRWRGAAPIQRAILAGDHETGVCLMQMAAGLDTGPVLARLPLPIGPEDTAGDLHDRLADMGGKLLIDTLPRLTDLTPEPQDDSGATYATKLEKREARIDWTKSAEQLAREVRAFNPWPVSHCEFGGKPLRIWSAQAVPGAGKPGEVMAADSDGIDVATGDGRLRIRELQRAGGKRMTAAQFLNAADPVGRHLE